MFAALLGAENIPPYFVFFEAVLVAALGLCMGSFASAIAHRIPLGQSWAIKGGRSACPSCGTKLRPRDLMPLFSWLINKGKCAHCGIKVSKLYPLLELSAAALAMLVLYVSTAPILAKIVIFIAIPFLMALFLIDLRHKILPNQLVLMLLVLGLLFLGLKYPYLEQKDTFLLSHLGGFVIYGAFSAILGLVMRKILRKEALGMGDVKFFAVVGLWLGLPYLGIYCILSGALGVILGIGWRILTKEEAFPFGPALIAAFFIILLLDGSFLLQKTIQ